MTKITTLTFNPAVDVSATVERVEPIHKLRCSAPQRDAGGGGINVARVVHRLGGDVMAVFTSGGMIGQLLSTLVAQDGVQNLAVPIAAETRESFNVFETTTGKEYRFILPGPRVSEDEWRACLEALPKHHAQPDFIVASGSLPPGVSDSAYRDVAKLAKERGGKFVVDSSGRALKAALSEGVYLIKPNLRELRMLTDEPLEDRDAWLRACRYLVKTGQAEMVALTLAHRGALLVTREGSWFAEAVPVELLSAVGAGDSFLGAFVWALCSQRGFAEALRYGVAAGSAALLTPATGLCRRDDIERLLGDVKVEAIEA